jgi:hypothetical protein
MNCEIPFAKVIENHGLNFAIAPTPSTICSMRKNVKNVSMSEYTELRIMALKR